MSYVIRGFVEGKRSIMCFSGLYMYTYILLLYVYIHIYISKTSRFYIGLAVGLPVFSNISIILTCVQTVLSLQGKATSRNWLNR